jgi:Hg(II)-responsive transcriptional regulator
MRIGQIAAGAVVNVQTLRYYERRGLLPSPPRGRSGYRDYEPDAVQRVRFIKHAQALGFTLQEIRELLALRLGSAGVCARAEARAEAAIARIDEQLVHLQRMRTMLTELAASCRRQDLTGDCPIMNVLEETRRV